MLQLCPLANVWGSIEGTAMGIPRLAEKAQTEAIIQWSQTHACLEVSVHHDSLWNHCSSV